MKSIQEEKTLTLQKPKADSPEKSAKMPDKYELVWLEFDNDGEIKEKNKSFESLEKFNEFKLELESNPNFLQINIETDPINMEQLPAAKSEKMEKVKIKEAKLRKLVRLMVIKEILNETNTHSTFKGK